MLPQGTKFRLSAVAIALVLVCGSVKSSWAASAGDEICDVAADQALGLENYPAAIALHQQVLRAHNDDALAHYHLGFAYGMIGRTTPEIDEYRTAARLHLRKWDLFLNLGLAYLNRNDAPNAIEALRTAVTLGANHSEAHFNLAIAYEKGDRLREALDEITAALQLAPDDLDAHNTKAIICAETGNLVCARDEWTYLVRVTPDYAPARVNLAILSGAYRPERYGRQLCERFHESKTPPRPDHF
jgi:Flp pilus assembly protein TadD